MHGKHWKKTWMVIWDIFHTLLGCFFFKICISIHINRYIACFLFNSMSGRGFCYVLVLFSPKEVRLEYKESYFRWVGMWKGWSILNRNRVVGEGLEPARGRGNCETECKYWWYLKGAFRTRSHIGSGHWKSLSSIHMLILIDSNSSFLEHEARKSR